MVEYHRYPIQRHAIYLFATTTHNEVVVITPNNDMYDAAHSNGTETKRVF